MNIIPFIKHLLFSYCKVKVTGMTIDSWGQKRWYKKGILHREDGPAIIVDGIVRHEEWYFDGLRHRIGGPAVTFFDDLIKVWLVNGKRHRIDGPAFDSPKKKIWFFNDHHIVASSQEEFDKFIQSLN